MKLLIAIGLLLLLALGGWLLVNDTEPSQNSTESEVTSRVAEPSTDDESMESNDTDEDGDTSITVDVEPTTDISVTETPQAQTFTLDSFNFGYSIEEIRVPAGTEVTINLTNSDGFHDWVVDEFSAATEAIRAGDTTAVTFTADTPGTYEYYCSVGNHRAQGMVGTLIVE